MDSLQIGNSQFADNCRIPRPTLSQMLNGRNKKVSDEIIAKIHSAYPQLSVLWLMFGEGNMLTDANSQISGSQASYKSAQYSTQDAEGEIFTQGMEHPNLFKGANAEKAAPSYKVPETLKSMPESGISRVETTKEADLADSGPRLPFSLDANQIANFNANSPKKIANIVVFYTDNSFQSFIPQE